MTGKFRVRQDRLLFVDVEMTCWDGQPPEGERAEIIEFGLAELDVETLTVIRTGSILVRPVSSSVSDYCERLTGISSAMLKKDGRRFSDATRTIAKDWGSGSKAWAGWGADRRAVEEGCAASAVASPFSEAWFDLGLQFGLMTGSRRRVGLTAASEALGLSGDWKKHSGMEDAAQTARVGAAMAARLREGLAPANAPAP